MTNLFRKSIFSILILAIASIISVAIFGQVNESYFGPYFGFGFRISAGLILFFVLILWLEKVNKKSFLWLLGLIFVLQILFLFSFKRPVYTDTGYIMTQVGRVVEGSSDWLYYFQIYPNNVNIVLWWATILKPIHWFGVSNFIGLTPWIQMIVLDVSVLFLGNCLAKINERVSLYFTIFTFAYFPIITYTLMPYSDIFTISLLMIAVGFFIRFLQVINTKEKVINGFFIFVPLVLAAIIRQNAIIILIALLLTILLMNGLKSKFKVFLIVFALLFTAGSVKTVTHLYSHAGFIQNKSVANPSISWVNMSWNPETNGEISMDAWAYSGEPKDVRSKKIRHDLIHRIKNYSIPGIVRHVLKKINFMFAIGYSAEDMGGLSITSPLVLQETQVRSINNAFGNMFQPFYIVVLVIAGYSAVLQLLKRVSDDGDKNKVQLFSAFSILGIFTFHTMLWEVRDRYTLLLIPFLLILAAFGVDELINQKKNWNWIGIVNKRKYLIGLVFVVLLGSCGSNISLTQKMLGYSGGVYSSGFSMYTEQGLELYSMKPNTVLETESFRTHYNTSNLWVGFGDKLNDNLRENLVIGIYDRHNNKMVSEKASEIKGESLSVNLKPGNYKIKIENKSNEVVKIPMLQNLHTQNLTGPKVYENGKVANGIIIIFSMVQGATVPVISTFDYYTVYGIYLLLFLLSVALVLRNKRQLNKK